MFVVLNRIENISIKSLDIHYRLIFVGMKCVFTLLALVAMVSAQEFSPTLFFTGTLDGIQGANKDIDTAAGSLAQKEGAVQGLVDGASGVFAAEDALETAVDVTAYKNLFKRVVDDDSRLFPTDADNRPTNGPPV